VRKVIPPPLADEGLFLGAGRDGAAEGGALCWIELERNSIPKRKNENNFVYYCEVAILVRVSAHGCGQFRFTGTQFG
jgi:hypothetical protein